MAVSITQTANPAGVSAIAGELTSTYSDISIGTEDSSRIVVVLVGTEVNAGTINSCTIDYGSGAVSMNAGSQATEHLCNARAFYLSVPTGTTATFVVSFGGRPSSSQNHIAVYSVLGGAYASAGADNSTDMDETDPLTTGAIDIATGGGFIAVASCATDTVAKTWDNATEDIDADAGGLRFTTATRTTSLTATAVTCTGGTDQEDGAMSWLIFNAGSSVKTIKGLDKASVKTINGLAVASVKNINGLA